MQGPRTKATAWAVIQGIEAANMIRKGLVLGITRQNLSGQAWVSAALLQGRIGLNASASSRSGVRRCNTSGSS
jgi:hypothetical protein